MVVLYAQVILRESFHDFIFKSALGIFVSFEITRFLSVVVDSLKNGIQITTNQKYDWLNE